MFFNGKKLSVIQTDEHRYRIIRASSACRSDQNGLWHSISSWLFIDLLHSAHVCSFPYWRWWMNKNKSQPGWRQVATVILVLTCFRLFVATSMELYQPALMFLLFLSQSVVPHGCTNLLATGGCRRKCLCTSPMPLHFSFLHLSRLWMLQEHHARNHWPSWPCDNQHHLELVTAYFAEWNHGKKRRLHGKRSWHKHARIAGCGMWAGLENKIAMEYDIKKSTLLTYIKNKDVILSAHEKENMKPSRKQFTSLAHPSIEGTVIPWIKHNLQIPNILLSGPITAAKAWDLANRMGIKDFTASKGASRASRHATGSPPTAFVVKGLTLMAPHMSRGCPESSANSWHCIHQTMCLMLTRLPCTTSFYQTRP